MSFTPGLILKPGIGFQRLSLESESGQYVVPAHLDARSRLLPSSDQGQTSECVVYSVAGWVEFVRWKYYGESNQVDPHPIYLRAKEIDGLGGGDGTTLEAGVQAAVDLGLIHTANVRSITSAQEVQRALHRYDVMIGAFICTDGWMNATPDGWIGEGQEKLGGHAVLLTGYALRDDPSYYQLQNSWGEGQGWRGFNRMTMPVFNDTFIYGLIWDQ